MRKFSWHQNGLGSIITLPISSFLIEQNQEEWRKGELRGGVWEGVRLILERIWTSHSGKLNLKYLVKSGHPTNKC